jgi:hypothetical protein
MSPMPDLDKINALVSYLMGAATLYRKGEVVTQPSPGVTEIYGYPAAEDARGKLADVHFVKVGLSRETTEKELLGHIETALTGEGVYSTLDLADLAGGPSYITLGGWLGSQDLALRLIGLAEILDLGKALTPGAIFGPATTAETQKRYDELAGAGFVMLAPEVAVPLLAKEGIKS